MPTLHSTPLELPSARNPDQPALPALPRGSAGWRAGKERLLCRTAAALRWCGGSRPSSMPGASSTGILTYHHVAQQVSSDPYLLNVTPDRFRRQMEGLLRLGYRACSLREVVACHLENKAAADKSFVVVFDDGHHSVYENAWPVLKDLGVPATIFLATGYLDRDGPLPFDACLTGPSCRGDARRPLTTPECEEMLGSGLIDLGSHTHWHEDFRGRPEQFSEDLSRSLQLLRDRFHLEQVTFSFPYGRFDSQMQQILQQHGLLCGLTTEQRCVPLDGSGTGADRFGWGRFGATELDTAHTLAGKLDGWYSWLQRWWRALRG